MHTKTRDFQLVFPINFEINIPADDSVRWLSNVLEEIDYTELYDVYSRKEKNTAVTPKNLFKILVYAYMNNIYSSRQIETAGKSATCGCGMFKAKLVDNTCQIC